MRRYFNLTESDHDFLESNKFNWETVKEHNMQWLLLHDFPVPDGYNCKSVTVALMIPPGYPVAQIDMAFFHPFLSRLDLAPIGALSFQNIDGRIFQRWSRHRTAQNPWQPGVDDVSTHLELVKYWFEREINKTQ
ncbi:MAG: hypothetical protein JST48_10625 [Bacteroidetes bacterium]|nr:hypothetical protein [Bacteroidota bacterium]